MANMYRDDDQAGRVGVASGSMRTCKTCGKPENPSKPHNHPASVPMGSGIANIGKQTLLDAKRKREEMLKRY
jgi:hypothetical protein